MIEDSMDPAGEWLAASVWAIVRYAQNSERIVAALTSVNDTADQLQRIAQGDEDLTPELQAAMTHLGEASAALKRAHGFCSARLTVEMEREIPGRSEGSSDESSTIPESEEDDDGA